MDKAVKTSNHWRSAIGPTGLQAWLGQLFEALKRYFDESLNAALAGRQIKYETTRLVILLEERRQRVRSSQFPCTSTEARLTNTMHTQIPLLTSGEIAPFYTVEETLKRLQFWNFEVRSFLLFGPDPAQSGCSLTEQYSGNCARTLKALDWEEGRRNLWSPSLRELEPASFFLMSLFCMSPLCPALLSTILLTP